MDNNRNDTPDAGEALRSGTIPSSLLYVRASPTILFQSNRIRFGADGFTLRTGGIVRPAASLARRLHSDDFSSPEFPVNPHRCRRTCSDYLH